MFFKNDEELIKNFHRNSGHSRNSVSAYRTVFNKYREFHQMSLNDLLKEAISDQESNVPEHRLKIYGRIIDFRNYLVKTHIASTITNSISKIKTFYRYNRIYLPFIPPLNMKSVKINSPIGFDDLITKEELKTAMNFANDDVRLWIMVLLSSGLPRMEAKSITNEMFFKQTRQYHKMTDFADAMEFLSAGDNVVCTCKLVRQKTGKPFCTFLNPECVQMIAKTKLKQEDFDLDAPLLKYNLNHVNTCFKSLNDCLGLGTAGGYSRLRPHMIRKFHATHLTQGSFNSTLDIDLVDFIHGRAKSKTQSSYFKDNPDYLKLKYIQAMNNISLYHKYIWQIVDGEIMVYSQKL